MKNVVLFLLMFIVFMCSISFSQSPDSLIQLSPTIGDTINYSEMKKYNLNFFERFSDFQYAVMYLRNDSILVSMLAYKDGSGILRDSTIIFAPGLLGKLSASIRQTEQAFVEKINESRAAYIYLKNGDVTKGVIESVNSTELILIDSNLEYSNLSFPIVKRHKFTKNQLSRIIFEGESKILSGVGYGFLTGFSIGALVGAADGNSSGGMFNPSAGEKAVIAGTLLGAGGALIGLITGASSSTSNEELIISDDFDLINLEKYSIDY